MRIAAPFLLAAVALAASCSVRTGPGLIALNDQATGRLRQLEQLELAGVDQRTALAIKAELKRWVVAAGEGERRLPTSQQQVTDLRLAADGDTWRLDFSDTVVGDYDGNGEVNITDITPLGQHFGATAADPGWQLARHADGDGNGEVNLADVTVIGQHLLEAVQAYAVLGINSGDQVYSELGWTYFNRSGMSYSLPELEFEYYAVAAGLQNARGPRSYPVYRQPGMLRFAGMEWILHDSMGELQSPGPNVYSWEPARAWVENPGRPDEELHLNCVEVDGQYHCVSLYSEQGVGYGSYIFRLGSATGLLDPRMVLGLFTFDATAEGFLRNANCEIDLEFSRWGDPQRAEALQYSVQPSFSNSPLESMLFPERYLNVDSPTLGMVESTHLFHWTPDSVDFTSFAGSDDLSPEELEQWDFSGRGSVSQWSFTSDNLPRVKSDGDLLSDPVVIPYPNETAVHLNLWWYRGDGDPGPSPGPQEVVLKGFRYLRLEPYPE